MRRVISPDDNRRNGWPRRLRAITKARSFPHPMARRVITACAGDPRFSSKESAPCAQCGHPSIRWIPARSSLRLQEGPMAPRRYKNTARDSKQRGGQTGPEKRSSRQKYCTDVQHQGDCTAGWIKYPERANLLGNENSDEWSELKSLRKKNLELRRKNDFLKNTAAFFARESK